MIEIIKRSKMQERDCVPEVRAVSSDNSEMPKAQPLCTILLKAKKVIKKRNYRK